jgi:hypothetical protein
MLLESSDDSPEQTPAHGAIASGCCFALCRGRLLLEGRRGCREPLRCALVLTLGDAKRVAALDEPGAAQPAPLRPLPAALCVSQLLRGGLSAGASVSLLGLVLCAKLLSSPHLCAGTPPPAAPQWGCKLRLRDHREGREGATVDVFLDAYRCALPPGVCPGALVRFSGLRLALSAHTGLPYLRASEAETRIQALRVPRAPREGTEALWARLLGGPRLHLSALYPPAPSPPPAALLRVRAAALLSASLRWCCARCGLDVAEAFPGLQQRCDACAQQGSAALRLLLAATVRLEDGTAAAECSAVGEAARLLLALPHGALLGLTRRHGRLEVSPSAAAYGERRRRLRVRGPAGAALAVEEEEEVLNALSSIHSAPQLLVRCAYHPPT